MILKYATQLLILLLIVSLISVAIISAIFYVSEINSQREQLSIILESVSQIGSDNISKWLDERKINVQNLAESRLFITSVKDLGNPELSSQEIFQSRLELERFSIYAHNSWYWLEGLKISDPNNGEMIFEFRDAPTANLREQQHFINALNGNIGLSEIYSSEEPIINEFGEYEKDVPTLLISAPIYSDVGLEGVLTARVNVFKIDTGVTKYVTDFNSGDAFMVNSDGFFLSRSAFPQDIVNFVERRPELELRVFDPKNQELTKLFQSADKNKPITIVDGYNDYRGIQVIGSINQIQDTDWFFIFEIDEAEAYQEFVVLQILVGYTLSILTMVVFGTSLHFSKTFARPIIDLKESAEEISSGNLDSPIKAKGSYEIVKLSESMDQMRKTIQNQIKELNYFKNALDESALVSITDKEGTITYANKKFEEVSKYPEGELLGQNHRILKSGYHPPEFFDELWKTISSGKIWKADIKNKAKDGSNYWVKTVIVPFLGKDGKPEQYLSVRVDITKQKKNEEDLAVAVVELKEIDIAKTEFLNMISHEFKNPLGPIIGFSKALQKPKLYGEINSKQLDALKKISTNAEGLQSMIAELLDIQNLELGTMEFDSGKFKVDELMREICKKFESKIIERKIQLVNKTQNSIVIQSDELKIKQVLSHLIDNAIDFVPKENGKIEICVQEADDSVLFFVKDNGFGIPKEKQENLFKKFYQVSQGHTRKHGGVGLGISICKGIITKLGGKIWVESEPGKGTAFYFNIPKKQRGEE